MLEPFTEVGGVSANGGDNEYGSEQWLQRYIRGWDSFLASLADPKREKMVEDFNKKEEPSPEDE